MMPNQHIQQIESPPKNRHLNTISKALISAVTEKKKIINPINHSFRVKTSALLYEITERTNKLAQPKTRINCNEKNSRGSESNKIDRILEASTRLIELAKPRVPFKPNLKPSFNVSPNALRYVANSRILELSKPRIKASLKLHRKKKFNSHPTCSSRIEHLAKPRVYQEQTKRKFSKRMNLSSQTAKKGKRSQCTSSVNEKSKKGSQIQNRVLQSNSNRSVIFISNVAESTEKSKSRKNRRKGKKRGKLTWMRKFIKDYPSSTLSNSSNQCVTS